MSIEESVQTVKNFLAALGDRNKQWFRPKAEQQTAADTIQKDSD
jgi:hypothetical protein